nr:MLO-like protein 13 isoform X2 [Oryza sativa Japonica Group]
MAATEATTIEDTPTWIVAAVCSAIVLISFAFERSLHYLGKALERRRRTLYEALLKLKEELMLLGFISLLLVVFQEPIQRICIAESLMGHWLPCRSDGKASSHHGVAAASAAVVSGAGARRLLGEGTAGSGHCSSKGKVPLLSLHAIEQIHIFIFVLAITHVVLSAVTVLLGLLQMRRWRHWENAIKADGDFGPKMINRAQQFKFIQDRYKGFDKVTMVIIWMRSFFKQFYGSVTKDDYTAMRLGFVMEHFRGHPKFNFYDYMIKALEKDYKRVVGIKWYLWIFVMIFLLLNITGWHSYFWISLIPLVVSSTTSFIYYAANSYVLTTIWHLAICTVLELAYCSCSEVQNVIAAAAPDRNEAGAHHHSASLRSGHEAHRRGGGHSREPVRQSLLVPQPQARARPPPLHPVPERVRVCVFHLDNGNVRLQLLHHGQAAVQSVKNCHMRRRPGPLQLQHAPPLRHRLPYGEFVQECRLLRRRRGQSKKMGRRSSAAHRKSRRRCWLPRCGGRIIKAGRDSHTKHVRGANKGKQIR